MDWNASLPAFNWTATTSVSVVHDLTLKDERGNSTFITAPDISSRTHDAVFNRDIAYYNASYGNNTGNLTFALNCSGVDLTNCTVPSPASNGEHVWSPGLNRPLVALIFIGFILSMFVVVTVLGNILVILSPVVNKRLRTVTNFFLVSLAFADVLIGVLVLPFSAYNELHRQWHMGAPFCNVYVSFDVLFCTASILNLFAICVDRYFAITRPMQYPLKMTMRRAAIATAALWAVSLLISFLPLHLGWNTPDGDVQNYNNPTYCGLAANTTYALVDGILLFFVPLTLMGLMYLKIVLIAQKQARSIRRTTVYDAHYKRSIDEHKATKIIAFVMGSFIVCWVPYFTAFTFCPAFHCNLNDNAYAVILWMGYFNSTMNPCLYAWLNREFRKAFKIIICCNRLTRRKFRKRINRGDRSDPTSTSSVMMTSTTRHNGTHGNGYKEIGNANCAKV